MEERQFNVHGDCDQIRDNSEGTPPLTLTADQVFERIEAEIKEECPNYIRYQLGLFNLHRCIGDELMHDIPEDYSDDEFLLMLKNVFVFSENSHDVIEIDARFEYIMHYPDVVKFLDKIKDVICYKE